MRALSFTLLAATFVFACDKGGETTAPEPAAGGETAAAGTDTEAAPAEEAAPKTWADMNLDERKMHMGTVVYPKMKEAFQGHDADAFADFKCQTCHGDDMEEVNFEMPQLVPLPVEGTMDAAMEMDEKMAKFMGGAVIPQMAEMMDMEPGAEMSCFSCHMKDE